MVDSDGELELQKPAEEYKKQLQIPSDKSPTAAFAKTAQSTTSHNNQPEPRTQIDSADSSSLVSKKKGGPKVDRAKQLDKFEEAL